MSQAPEPGRNDVRLYRCSIAAALLASSCLPIGIGKQNYAKTGSRYAAASRFCGEIRMNRI